MKTPRAPLPVARIEQDGHRVDIYAPRDGVWSFELYTINPVTYVGLAAKHLRDAEAEARRLLERRKDAGA